MTQTENNEPLNYKKKSKILEINFKKFKLGKKKNDRLEIAF